VRQQAILVRPQGHRDAKPGLLYASNVEWAIDLGAMLARPAAR